MIVQYTFIVRSPGAEVVNGAVHLQANCFEVLEADGFNPVIQESTCGVWVDTTFLQKEVGVFDTLLVKYSF